MDSAKNRKMREGNIRSQTHPKPEKSECKIAAVHHSQSRCPEKRGRKRDLDKIFRKFKGEKPFDSLDFCGFFVYNSIL